jgi:hypothetical protein
MSRLCEAEYRTEAGASDFATSQVNEVTPMEYVIVFSVAAMMTWYVSIIARCLRNA